MPRNAFVLYKIASKVFYYRLLKYQLKPSAIVSAWKGVGTSAKPGLATGCLKYTAEQMF